MQVNAFVRLFAERIANEPQQGEQSPRVFFVGGTVRDRIRSGGEEYAEGSDVDVEVYGVEGERVQCILEELLQQKVNVFGAAFGVFRLTFFDGSLDVSLPRTESKKGTGHRGFVISGNPHLSFVDALRRRDFTVNAVLADVLTGELIDPFYGQDDIVHGILRVVDAKTFPDDPLRIFRAMQFIARFDYRVEEESLSLFKKMSTSAEVRKLSSERVTQEWKKMLSAPFPEEGILFLRETGLLALYPSLCALPDISQDPHWHPEGSVWEHTLLCLQVSSGCLNDDVDPIAFRLALLLHDAGKKSVSRKKKDCNEIDAHAAVGVERAKEFFKDFTFGERIERDVLACIAYHEALPALYRMSRQEEWPEKKTANALRMLWRDVGVDRVPLLLAVCEANARGRDLPLDDRAYPVRVWAEELSKRYRLFAEAQRMLVSGDDLQHLMERLHIRPLKGKAFGACLQEIEDARDRGEIATRGEAIDYAEKILMIRKKS